MLLLWRNRYCLQPGLLRDIMSSNKSICFTEALEVFFKSSLGWESCFSWHWTYNKEHFPNNLRDQSWKWKLQREVKSLQPPNPSPDSSAAEAGCFGGAGRSQCPPTVGRGCIKHACFQFYHSATKAGQAIKRENECLGQPLLWRTLVQKLESEASSYHLVCCGVRAPLPSWYTPQIEPFAILVL